MFGWRTPRAGVGGALESLAPLLESLADEARREAEALVAEAERRGGRRSGEAEASARRLEAAAAAAGREEGARLARRRVALAELEARQAALCLRASLVEQALELAARRLVEPARELGSECFLTVTLRAAARILGETTLRVRVRSGDAARLPALLEGSGLRAEIEEADGIEAGVQASTLDGRRTVDMTLRGILERRREEARQAAAAVLFRGPP